MKGVMEVQEVGGMKVIIMKTMIIAQIKVGEVVEVSLAEVVKVMGVV